MCALNRVGLILKSIFWRSWLWAEEETNPETSQSSSPLDAPGSVSYTHRSVFFFFFSNVLISKF